MNWGYVTGYCSHVYHSIVQQGVRWFHMPDMGTWQVRSGRAQLATMHARASELPWWLHNTRNAHGFISVCLKGSARFMSNFPAGNLTIAACALKLGSQLPAFISPKPG